ncbi:hypothetical protein FYJ78_12565 [Selenomonas sp. WCA-380-WT-3B 3/]|uniref:Uncharacterized protein n=1 Tax=Selenomonas montiformis TaxID=2652285 RepID=A0A6I2UZV8_9FIRM|nr:hypothetical protein [Selenomonas montiformis]MSV25979.1 hypothetical protein [Selenomonas montiformis]
MKKIMVADAVIDLAGTHDELMRTFGYSSDRAWEIAEKLCSDRYGVNFESLHAFMGRKVDGSANLAIAKAQAYLEEKHRQESDGK